MEAEETAAIEAPGRNTLVSNASVSDRKQVEVLFKQIKDKFGRIHILVNNAGITKDSTLLKMTEDQWKQVMDVNLTGVFNCTQLGRNANERTKLWKNSEVIINCRSKREYW